MSFYFNLMAVCPLAYFHPGVIKRTFLKAFHSCKYIPCTLVAFYHRLIICTCTLDIFKLVSVYMWQECIVLLMLTKMMFFFWSIWNKLSSFINHLVSSGRFERKAPDSNPCLALHTYSGK